MTIYTPVSPAIAGNLCECKAGMARRIVRELPLGSAERFPCYGDVPRHVSTVHQALLRAQWCLLKNDVPSADRFAQHLVRQLSVSPQSAFLQQPAPWLLLARLAFLRDDLHGAQVFLAKSISLTDSGDRDEVVGMPSRAICCFQQLLQAILHAEAGIIDSAWVALSHGETHNQIADGPDALRLILLTRCCLELHQHRFDAAWKAFQSADLLRTSSERQPRHVGPNTGSERQWLRQWAGLQQTADAN